MTAPPPVTESVPPPPTATTASAASVAPLVTKGEKIVCLLNLDEEDAKSSWETLEDQISPIFVVSRSLTAGPVVMTPPPVAPSVAEPLSAKLMLLTPTELLKWHKLKKENPLESGESCLERLAAPRASPGGCGGDHAGGSATVHGTGAVVVKESKNKKREREAGSTQGPRKYNKVKLRDDEEAKSLFEHMVRASKEYVEEKLPGMNRTLLSSKVRMDEYKEGLERDVAGEGKLFGNDALRSKLLASSGKYSVLYSRPELIEYLRGKNDPLTNRFYAVFNNAAAVKNWFKK